MPRTVWSSDKFDDKLATLFEEYEGREESLQQKLNQVVQKLLEGDPRHEARRHNVSGASGEYFLPLIGDYVIVYSLAGGYPEGLDWQRRNQAAPFQNQTSN